MGFTPQQNGNFIVKKGEYIFLQGDLCVSMNIMLQGKIEALFNPFPEKTDDSESMILGSSRLFTIEESAFFGAQDIFLSQQYSFTYRAAEDTVVYSFVAGDIDQARQLFAQKEEYSAYVVNSMAYTMLRLRETLFEITKMRNDMESVSDNLIAYFWFLKDKLRLRRVPSSQPFKEGIERYRQLKTEEFPFPFPFDPEFIDFGQCIQDDLKEVVGYSSDLAEYLTSIMSVPKEISKKFFATDWILAEYHMRQASILIHVLTGELSDRLSALDNGFSRIYAEGEECAFSEYVLSAIEMREEFADPSPLLTVIDYLSQKIRAIASKAECDMCRRYDVDAEYMENMILQAKTENVQKSSSGNANGETVELSAAVYEMLPDDIKNTLQKLTDYIIEDNEEMASAFLGDMVEFRRLSEKLSDQPEAVALRKKITETFWPFYEAVFNKSLDDIAVPRFVTMFLDYGFADERLLKPEDCLKLYKMSQKSSSNARVPVYTLSEWLKSIKDMDKAPSINEFEEDYFTVFRSKKKRGEVTDADKEKYDNDAAGRLHFEIESMCKVTQQICHGHLTTYVPILHAEAITRDLTKTVVTAEAVNNTIDGILATDFSVFHREVFLRKPEEGIENEMIMKPFYPDVIITPIFGTRGCMWQDIEGRNRGTAGRFILPAFTQEPLDIMMVRVIAHFRWELCRTMMGMSWNDIREKSLTSEYSDYLQFFRKNRDFSEEVKSKIKQQLLKNRNIVRDVFAEDYALWLLYEAKGIMRLNKHVRRIMYENCLFSAKVRESVAKLPMFSDIANVAKNKRARKAKDLENHYFYYTKTGKPLHPDLQHNLEFYRDM